MRQLSAPQLPSRLVAIDAGVSDLNGLLSGVLADAEVVVLDRNRDGLSQLSQALTARPHIRQLHLISHGRPGCLFLGNLQLDRHTLHQRADEVRDWLKSDRLGAIALYGCHLAAGDLGCQFLDLLHRLTGVDLAASTTAVGHGNLGGNWDLDGRWGRRFDLELAIDAPTRAAYAATFAPPTFSGTIEDITVPEDTASSRIEFLPFFSDPDQSAESLFYVVSNNSNPSLFSTVSISNNRLVLEYQDNLSGTADLRIRAADDDLGTAFSNTFTVTVTPENDPPVAADFNAGSTTEDAVFESATDASGAATDLDNFISDIDSGDSASIVPASLTSSKGAIVSINADGTYRYDPTNADALQGLAAGQSTTDTFTYTARDTNGATDTGTVTITVTGLNDELRAVDDTATLEPGSSLVIPVLENDNDTEGGNFVILNFDTDTTQGGSVSQTPNGLLYTPPDAFTGEDTFNYTITDGLSTDSATVTVTVNRPPRGVDDRAFNDDPEETVTIDVLANDTDPDTVFGDRVGVESVGTPVNGGRVEILTNNNTDPSDDRILYTPPDTEEPIVNSFEYTVSDRNGATDTAKVVINPPNAVNDVSRTRPGLAVSIAVLNNDVRFNNVSIVSFDDDALNGGSVTRDGSLLVYTSENDFEGIDFFNYTIEDSEGNRDTATVEVLVSPDVELPPEPEPEVPGNPDVGSVITIPPINIPDPFATVDTREVASDSGENTLFGDENPNRILGKGGRDILVGLDAEDDIEGGDGDDQIFGNLGNDFLQGQAGDDLIFAGAQNDFLSGGEGNDEMAGESGDDLILGQAGDDLIFGNAGIDRIDGGDGADTILGGKDNDVLTGGFGENVMAGDIGFDTVQGGADNDLLFGNQDNDILDGAGGDDSLFGGQNDDVLYGAGGNDRLKGDRGNDILVGGGGADRFIIRNDGSQDRISDFSRADGDKIVLDADLGPADIVIQPSGNNTQLRIVNTDIVLAVVENVPFDDLATEDFLFE